MKSRRIVIKTVGILLLGLGLTVSLSDFITPQGERTIYTAECKDGNWKAEECTGILIAGDRFRFRALKAHREVLFWTLGSSREPSGKFTDCDIRNGRNWNCKADTDLRLTITHEMVRGRPVSDASGKARQFHQIPKWHWLLLRIQHSSKLG